MKVRLTIDLELPDDCNKESIIPSQHLAVREIVYDGILRPARMHHSMTGLKFSEPKLAKLSQNWLNIIDNGTYKTEIIK